MITRSLIILTTASVLVTESQATLTEPDISGVVIENVGYAGNGCPEGSATVVLASDKKSLSVSFDDFIVAAGGHGQRTFAREKCDLALGFKIPAGISLSIGNAAYSGFISLPSRSSATITRNYFFAGERGPRLKKTWKGEQKK